MSRPVWARINLNALQHNLQRVVELAPARSILAVVKANAYGHDAGAIAPAIDQRVDGFAVAGVDEALTLVEAGVTKQMHLLSGFHQPDELPVIRKFGFIPVIHSWRQVEQLETSTSADPMTLWVKVDTGMHRLGFSPADLAQVVDRVKRSVPGARIGLMSHLACADDIRNRYTERQIAVFDETTRSYDHPRSLANSAGICAWSTSHNDLVRPGIMLYGCSPLLDRDEKALDLQPVMSFCARLIAIHRLQQGEPVGYGGDWRSRGDAKIGVVACGYGDGYPRHAGNRAKVWVNGRRAPVVGRVSMDMMTVDLSEVDHVDTGDEVELWGQHVSVAEVAAAAGTIAYEILTGVASRVPRVMD